jgi:hypothetical protein
MISAPSSAPARADEVLDERQLHLDGVLIPVGQRIVGHQPPKALYDVLVDPRSPKGRLEVLHAHRHRRSEGVVVGTQNDEGLRKPITGQGGIGMSGHRS